MFFVLCLFIIYGSVPYIMNPLQFSPLAGSSSFINTQRCIKPNNFDKSRLWKSQAGSFLLETKIEELVIIFTLKFWSMLYIKWCLVECPLKKNYIFHTLFMHYTKFIPNSFTFIFITILFYEIGSRSCRGFWCIRKIFLTYRP